MIIETTWKLSPVLASLTRVSGYPTDNVRTRIYSFINVQPEITCEKSAHQRRTTIAPPVLKIHGFILSIKETCLLLPERTWSLTEVVVGTRPINGRRVPGSRFGTCRCKQYEALPPQTSLLFNACTTDLIFFYSVLWNVMEQKMQTLFFEVSKRWQHVPTFPKKGLL